MLEASGTDGQVKVDSENVYITRKGLFARFVSLDEGGDEVIPMARIIAVGYTQPKMGIKGHIQFGVLDKDGKATVTSSNAGFAVSLATGNLKHSVIFAKNVQSDFEKIRDFVEAQIKLNPNKALSTAPVSSISVADELKKLSELRDSGIISDLEFDQQKKKLL